ncbi:MAG: DegT/DnrJ/EryC1/StrS family aminotransferase [Candidatus Omnitrophica bacterium]|nr:DegT/DnrJ/EryC1/StrS family aminotransferase [Candidatus Omnitrophota bacterium]
MKVSFGTMSITQSAKDKIVELLEKGAVSSGKTVRDFEEQFAALIGTKEGVAVSTGTDADMLALAVLYDFGAKRGDEVIVPALSFVATGNAVLHAGFTPVFVDIDRNTLNINPCKIEAAISKKTRAIVPVHLMGKPAQMDIINDIAQKHKLYVIEDAAEAHGAVYKGKNIGTWGHMSAYSLYVAHIISTIEGGIVLTDNPEMADILRSLRSHGRFCKCKQCVISAGEITCKKRFVNGQDRRFFFERVGFSSKMNELEAAVGLGNLAIFNDILDKRHKNLIYLIDSFQQFAPVLTTISEGKDEKIGPHAFPVLVSKDAGFSRDELVAYLSDNNIDSRNLFLSMPTQCPGFEFLGYSLGDFPEAEFAGDQGFHIGVHQDLGEKECDYFIEVVAGFVRKSR